MSKHSIYYIWVLTVDVFLFFFTVDVDGACVKGNDSSDLPCHSI